MLLIDATPLQSEHRWRGVGEYLRQLIQALEHHCAENNLDAPHYLLAQQGEASLALEPSRCHHIWRPHRPAQVYWLYNEAALRYALQRLRPQLLLAADFNGLVANPFGSTVAVLHDLTAYKLAQPAKQTAENSPALRARASQALSDWRWYAYYRKLQSSRHIIAISQQVKDDAIALLGIAAERMHVVHHGVDHSRYQPQAGQGDFAERGRYIINLGGRNANKNQDRLLRAFAQIAPQHPDLQLFFAGPWGAGDKAWLEQESQRLGVAASVQHLGYVANEAMTSLYSNALAFAFPSLEEGFGMPVLEAMACGAPVLSSTTSSLPEVAGEAALLVDPYDEQALAEGLNRLASDAGLCEDLRQRGIARAKQFTWARTAAQTWAVLEQAASQRSKGKA